MEQRQKKEFIEIFKELSHSRGDWQTWSDTVTAIACCISNTAEQDNERKMEREDEFEKCIKRLGGIEKPAKLMHSIIEALEENPEQDFLGKMYMELNLASNWKKQHFTPYNICELMIELDQDITIANEVRRIGWASVSDPAVGAGATLIAAANKIRVQGINYQNSVFFVGQDIDRTVGLMAYIQLSLLGCPGYIVIADSIAYPVVGNMLTPCEKPEQEFWYMPFYYRDIWTVRRAMADLR